jgi:hypothetical protein
MKQSWWIQYNLRESPTNPGPNLLHPKLRRFRSSTWALPSADARNSFGTNREGKTQIGRHDDQTHLYRIGKLVAAVALADAAVVVLS